MALAGRGSNFRNTVTLRALQDQWGAGQREQGLVRVQVAGGRWPGCGRDGEEPCEEEAFTQRIEQRDHTPSSCAGLPGDNVFMKHPSQSSRIPSDSPLPLRAAVGSGFRARPQHTGLEVLQLDSRGCCDSGRTSQEATSKRRQDRKGFSGGGFCIS